MIIDSSKFTYKEVEEIFALAEKLTGTNQEKEYRRGILLQNIARRMQDISYTSVEDYLLFARKDDEEKKYLLSCLTIHTTSWFREKNQLFLLRDAILQKRFHLVSPIFSVASVACSSGEEVFSLALILEELRRKISGFDYKLTGYDIDPVSIRTAKRAIYSFEKLREIPSQYHRFLKCGTGKTEGLLTMCKEIRERCDFYTKNLTVPLEENYHVIFCRNVLIYFEYKESQRIIKSLVAALSSGGWLCLGSSEAVGSSAKIGLKRLGISAYEKMESYGKEVLDTKIKSVLIVDDSKVIRLSLKKYFELSGFHVILAASAEEASNFFDKNSVDIVSLDLRMPKEDGHIWLARMRKQGFKTPVIIVSDPAKKEAPEVIECLSLYAQDYAEKSLLQIDPQKIVEKFEEVLKAKNSATSFFGDIVNVKNRLKLQPVDLLLFGASTGGTEILCKILRSLPKNSPPICVVQHMKDNFLEPFAERLAKISGLKLADIEAEKPLARGMLYLARGDFHIKVIKTGITADSVKVVRDNGRKVHNQRPAVDVLFESASKLDLSIAAFLLTGMGRDGANGLLALKNKGAQTLVQEQKSCVVFGMPKAALDLEAAQFVGTPDELRLKVEHLIRISQ